MSVLTSGTVTQAGTLTARNQSVTINTAGYQTVTIGVSGVITAGTLFVSISNDNGLNYSDAIPFVSTVTGIILTTLLPSNGLPDVLYVPAGESTQIKISSNGTFAGAVAIVMLAGNGNSAAYNASPTAFTTQGVVRPTDLVIPPGVPVVPLDVASNRVSIGAIGIVHRGGTNWDVLKSSLVYKSAQASAAGSTPLWTPTATKKFNVMRYMVQLTGNAARAVAGVLTISLLDAGADIAQDHDVWVPAASLNTSGDLYTSPWIDLGNGVLSAAANNALNINLSAALTSGNVRVIACGTEE